MITHAQLEQIGLSKQEATLYLASLTLGPSSVLGLANATSYNRPLLYRLLGSLIEQGVFQTTITRKRRLYVAAPPKRLLGVLRMKESLLRDMLPELEAMATVGTNKPRILYFEGREQIQELLKTQHEAKSKQIYAFFPSNYMIQLFGKQELEAVIHERIHRGIHIKVLSPLEDPEEYAGAEEREHALREVRYIPDNKIFGMGIVIYDNKVNLFSPSNENFGIQIESEAYSSIMKYFFEALWSLSKENKNAIT